MSKPYQKFLACCQENIWSNLKPKINCTIIGFDEVRKNITEFQPCNSNLSAAQALYIIYAEMNKLLVNPAKYGCPMPCRPTSYKLEVNYMHKNTWFNPLNMSPDTQLTSALTFDYPYPMNYPNIWIKYPILV